MVWKQGEIYKHKRQRDVGFQVWGQDGPLIVGWWVLLSTHATLKPDTIPISLIKEDEWQIQPPLLKT